MQQSQKIDAQFENFIPSLIEFLKKENSPDKVKNRVLSILSNISLRETLRPQIISSDGINFFLKIVKQEDNNHKSVEA